MRFNGKELTGVHRAISIEKEIPPGAAARKMETIETADGEIVTSERITAGEYVVRVNIVGKTMQEGWAVRELLAGYAQTDGIGTAELVPTHRPQRCYDARLKSISDPEFVHGGAKMEMRFFLPRPVARSVSESREIGAGKIRARIGGTYECRPAITQTIAAAQDGLVWKKNGVTILTIKGALSPGQVVRMDTRGESLTIDGVHAEDRLDIEHTRWRAGYLPGDHEIVSTDGGALEMRWHEEWA